MSKIRVDLDPEQIEYLLDLIDEDQTENPPPIGVERREVEFALDAPLLDYEARTGHRTGYYRANHVREHSTRG